MIIEYLTTNPAGIGAIGAAMAVGICGLAAGLCEGGIGETCINKGMLEDGKFGKALIMVTIGESVVIYGFTIAMIIVMTTVCMGMF